MSDRKQSVAIHIPKNILEQGAYLYFFNLGIEELRHEIWLVEDGVGGSLNFMKKEKSGYVTIRNSGVNLARACETKPWTTFFAELGILNTWKEELEK